MSCLLTFDLNFRFWYLLDLTFLLSFIRALLASITYFHLPRPEHRAGLWKTMILIFITALVTYVFLGELNSVIWWYQGKLRKLVLTDINEYKWRHSIVRGTLSIDIIYFYLTLFFVWHTKVALTTEKHQLDFKIWYWSNIKLCIS